MDLHNNVSSERTRQRRTTVHPPQPATRVHEDGREEPGTLFFVEKTFAAGCLRASYEYNIYYWLESQTWEADVISPSGWHDVENDELEDIIEEFGIVPAEM